jgi:hypothetical protein
MTIVGSNKKVSLWNKDGIMLGNLGETKDWIWDASVQPKTKNIFVSDNSGNIKMLNTEF